MGDILPYQDGVCNLKSNLQVVMFPCTCCIAILDVPGLGSDVRVAEESNCNPFCRWYKQPVMEGMSI